MDVPVKGLVKDTDRHGNDRYYYRVKGLPKVRLREPFGSEAFREELRCAQLGLPYRVALPEPDNSPAARAGTLKWLALEYLRVGCVGLGEATISRKRYALEGICAVPIKGKQSPYAIMPYRVFSEEDAEHLRDHKAETPEAANYWVKTLSAMFNWAREKKANGVPLMSWNPAEKVAKFRIATDGHHTWTLGEIQQYRERHPLGTMADLALRIILFTGLRISDAAPFGRQHCYERKVVVDGVEVIEKRFRIKPKKTAVSSGVEVDMQILPPLQEALDLVPKTQLAFIESNKRKPYSGKVLGYMMRDWCDQAGLQHCSAHGLRKALASMAAESGATDRQLMAMFGWTTEKQANIYTKAAERRALASDGASKLRLV